jgi:hypothetical protein
MKAKAALRPTEAQIEKAISDLLELDGWRALKTDPVSDRARGKGFGELGMADHLYIRYNESPMWVARGSAQVLWIEHKRLKGVVADHQRTWHAAERARGALTLIAGQDFPATVEGFWGWYRASSLMRKDIRL